MVIPFNFPTNMSEFCLPYILTKACSYKDLLKEIHIQISIYIFLHFTKFLFCCLCVVISMYLSPLKNFDDSFTLIIKM